MQTKHTKGQWVVLPAYTGTSRFPIGVARKDGAHDIIGEFNGQGGVGDEITANARLAAAAPDLLACVKSGLAEILEAYGGKRPPVIHAATRALHDQYAAAIAKATGA